MSVVVWKLLVLSGLPMVLLISLVSFGVHLIQQTVLITNPPESGETMRVAGLKAISTVVESSAILIKSKHPSDPQLIDKITRRIRGVITAQHYVLCTYNIPRSKLGAVKDITPGKRAPTINSLEEEGWVAVSAMVETKKIGNTMDRLEEVGAEDILVTKLENSRTTLVTRNGSVSNESMSI
jgi:ATP phosphoribosyltransferase-like protein